MACLMDIRRKIIAESPHLATASSGNTADSTTICHIKTDVPADVKQLTVGFSPTQSGSGTPSPINIRAISGISRIDITRCGVNLLQSYAASNGAMRGVDITVTRNGSGEVTEISMIGTANLDNVFRNLNYTAGTNHLLNAKVATNAFSNQANIVPVCSTAAIKSIDGYDAGQLPAAGMYVYNINKSAYGDGWFRIQAYPYASNGISYNTVVYPFVSLYQDRNSTFEPYNGQTITMTLPKECYGGYIDILNGTLVVTKGKCVVNENNSISTVGDAGNGKVRAWCFLNNERLLVRDVPPICDRMVYTNKDYSGHYSASVGQAGEFGNATAYPNSLWFWLPYGGTDGVQEATVNGVKAYLKTHPMTFIGDLETPQTYQLTPQTLKTLRGINNIWSDQGTVEIKYWTH